MGGRLEQKWEMTKFKNPHETMPGNRRLPAKHPKGAKMTGYEEKASV